jgi:hypothetical protein
MSEKKTRLEWTYKYGYWVASAGAIDLQVLPDHLKGYVVAIGQKIQGKANTPELAKELAETALKAECEKWAEAARALGLPLAPVPQPIETAPRDGTSVLAYGTEYGWEESYWIEGLKCWSGLSKQPTHGLPLPQTPEVQG